MNKKSTIFVDLDETLWHSTTPMYFDKRFLLPEETLMKWLQDPNLVTEELGHLKESLDIRTSDLLDLHGYVDGTFEYDRKRIEFLREAEFEAAVKKGWTEFWFSGGEHYMSKLRPNAVKFLKEISKLGDLHVCTSSTEEYATMLTKGLGIAKFFKTISPREKIRSFDVFPNDKKSDNWILIDDLPPYSESISAKIRFITGNQNTNWEEAKKRVVQVKEWYGDPLDDHLMSLIGEIKERLESLKNG